MNAMGPKSKCQPDLTPQRFSKNDLILANGNHLPDKDWIKVIRQTQYRFIGLMKPTVKETDGSMLYFSVVNAVKA